MTEHEADQVMEHIAALESNPFSTVNAAMLKHLYKMHKLRDEEFWHQALLDPDLSNEDYTRMQDMQTF